MYRSTNSPIGKTLLQAPKFVLYDNNVKISRSCDYCKAKKVKCDQLKPDCSYCIKHNETCVYSKVRKPGIKPGYGQHVLDKLKNIESTLHTESSRSRNEMDIVNQKLLELEAKIVTLESSKLFTDTFSPQNIDSSKEELAGGNSSSRKSLVQITNVSTKEGATIKDANTVLDSGEFPTASQVEKLVEIFFDKIHPIIIVKQKLYQILLVLALSKSCKQ